MERSFSSLLGGRYSISGGDNKFSEVVYLVKCASPGSNQEPHFAYASIASRSELMLTNLQPDEDPLLVNQASGDSANARIVLEDDLLYSAPLPCLPPAIICIGLNYKRHAKEVGMPLPKYPIFLHKNPFSVIGPDEDIIIPKVAQEPPEVDYEVEMGIVIGKARSGQSCKDVSPEDVHEHILGFIACNDVSARRWQGKKRGGGQWSRAKSFDTFCPVGPAIRLCKCKEDVEAAGRLNIETRLNGVPMQSSSTKDLAFSIQDIVAFLSEGTTLLPGTVILTGTPEGVGYTRDPPVYLKHGDEVTVEVEGCGALRNKVVEDGY